MKQLTSYNRVAGYLNKVFDILNEEFFEGELSRPTITIQSTPKAYGHFSLREDTWISKLGETHEINIGAGTLSRPIEEVAATLLHILNMGLVENTLTGNLILTVMLAFAEYERGTIVERTQTGKAVARQDPNFKDGRPKKFKPEQIALALSLLEQGKTYRQITTMTGISKSTLIRAKRGSE